MAILRNGERLGVFEGAFARGDGGGDLGQIVLEVLAAVAQGRPMGDMHQPATLPTAASPESDGHAVRPAGARVPTAHPLSPVPGPSKGNTPGGS
jgi:hypothetical protein